MCAVCVQWQLGKLTKFEARKGLRELINTETVNPQHVELVETMLEEEKKETE